MELAEIAVLGGGLAMDAAAVAMANGMIYRRIPAGKLILMPLLFGGFQGLMPLLGFHAGSVFAGAIAGYSRILVFVILFAIGANMIREGVSRGEMQADAGGLTFALLSAQAVATSIDAFAIGIGLCAADADILPASAVIALVTAVLVAGAVPAGRRFGDLFENKTEVLGGTILIIIGIKALL